MPSRVVAIVCAKDEGPRIGAVLDVLCPILPTLVVDDGSSDDTAEQARSRGATVYSLPKNIGKGRAMLEGVKRCSQADVVLFADADLVGLRPEHVHALIEPVLREEFGMVVGMRDHGERYGDDSWNEVANGLPLISGERAVRRDLLLHMPEQAWNGFGVETWMNHAVTDAGARIGTVLLPGLSIVLKWEKEGMHRGISKMADMGAEIVRAHEDAARHFSGVTAPSQGMQLLAKHSPLPPSFTARNASSEEVLRALSKAIVDASSPMIHQNLWTPETRHEISRVIGAKMAMPLWTLTCATCMFFFGPFTAFVALAGAFINVSTATDNANTRRLHERDWGGTR